MNPQETWLSSWALATNKQHGKHLCACHPSRVIVLHSQLRRAACQRIDAARGRSGTHLHLRLIRTAMQTLRRAPLSLPSLLPAAGRSSSISRRQAVTGSSSVRRDRATKPWKVDDMQRRRRVLHQLIQAALWAPTMGENGACEEALMEQQGWEESAQVRWPETDGLVVQNGAVGPRSG